MIFYIKISINKKTNGINTARLQDTNIMSTAFLYRNKEKVKFEI